jgi:hypothetical protein
MFYLGTIAGILPYILSLSLTILWCGHVTVPLFKPHCVVDSASVIKKECNPSPASLQCIDYQNKVALSETLQLFTQFSIPPGLFAICPTLLFETTESGISCLPAPPAASL